MSQLVGNKLENAVEDALVRAGVSYRRTKRAERLPGFDQAPAFVVPSEFNPNVVIEAKAAEDDGTARDKVARVQHLTELASGGRDAGEPRFEVVACIAGRGFAVSRSNVAKLLLATRGKLFTLSQLDRFVEGTSIREFRSRR